MGQKCGPKAFLYTITSLQLLLTVERQIFDFLGYMWVPILMNFLHLLFVILGIFGVFQYRLKYLLSYLCWLLIWIAWNSFIVCFYLNIGDLKENDDILSFGTGSFSWWLVNGFGCNPEYFPDNSALEPDESKKYLPVKPAKVTGCLIQYQYVEITHAGIQIVFAGLGFLFGAVLAHHLVTVVKPKRKKSANGNNPLYSIEFSPQVADSVLNRDDPNWIQETNFNTETRVNGNGAAAGHMTPRRVKRRSYTRNSTRSAGKVQSNKHRSSTRSTRSLGRATGSRAINPVTRLMERDDLSRNPIVDSSTSNDGTERYGVSMGVKSLGMVNHAFETSRPNSLYSAIPGGGSVLSNQQSSITDCETISRPPSALTSYSNFHGQRRPVHQGMSQATNLTQESLNNGNLNNNFGRNQQGSQDLLGGKFLHNGFDQGNVNQQQPINNYANNTSYDDLPPPPPPLSSSPTDEVLRKGGNESDSAQDSSISMPVPQQRNNPRRNEYVNMPVSHAQTNVWNNNEVERTERPLQGGGSIASSTSPDMSAQNRIGNQRSHNYANMGFSYMPEPATSQNRYSQIGSRSSRYTDSSAEESLSLGHQNANYNDMMTLRVDTKLNYHPDEAKQNSISLQPHSQQQKSYASQPLGSQIPSLQQPSRPILTQNQRRPLPPIDPPKAQQPSRHIAIDYDYSNEPIVNGAISHSTPQKTGIPQRVPAGNERRDRVSLRAKHKQQMEEQKVQKQMKKLPDPKGPSEDDYGFTAPAAGRPTSIMKKATQNGMTNGNHQPPDDKWYLHDSMKPVGAPQHGGNCKCYRCQRKLTAI